MMRVSMESGVVISGGMSVVIFILRGTDGRACAGLFTATFFLLFSPWVTSNKSVEGRVVEVRGPQHQLSYFFSFCGLHFTVTPTLVLHP
jgi:hypothetical protein